MLEQINSAMVEMQGALLARGLYPEGHPRIRNGQEKALELLRGILESRPEITLIAVDNRVVFEGDVLPASPNLIDTLFGALRRRGADRLSIRRGLDPRELQQFLDALAAAETSDDPALQPSANMRFGALQAGDLVHVDEEALDSVLEASLPIESPEAAAALAEVWEGVDEGQNLNTGVLRDIVASLSHVVSDSAGAMLPLAPLKQHDEYTFVHTINVAMLSTALGEALGFDHRSTHELSIAALLHDVGKRAIPKELLNKAGRFTEEEFNVMKLHTVEGARILLNTADVPDIAPVVAYEHHVRADGSGYPKVPRGWRLSLASRIVQLADVFDALRTDRPYRPGQPVAKIIEIMKADVGTFFDADLLLVFLQNVISRGVPLQKTT